MKIEITPHEHRKGVLLLTVDEEFFREIHTSIFGRRPQFSFHSEDVSEQFAQKEFERANFFVLRRLTQRSYSSFELRSQLVERLVSTATIDRVLDECVRLGYLDDVAWLESFIRGQKSKKIGPKMIESKLYQKGIPKSFYAQYLEKGMTDEEQMEGIEKLLNSRFRSKDLSDYKEKQKVIASLIRKGFDFELVSRIINKWLNVL